MFIPGSPIPSLRTVVSPAGALKLKVAWEGACPAMGTPPASQAQPRLSLLLVLCSLLSAVPNPGSGGEGGAYRRIEEGQSIFQERLCLSVSLLLWRGGLFLKLLDQLDTLNSKFKTIHSEPFLNPMT